jgi:hypothetical protein
MTKHSRSLAPNVLDTVIEPDGEYIIKCDDGRRLVAPRSLFNDV